MSALYNSVKEKKTFNRETTVEKNITDANRRIDPCTNRVQTFHTTAYISVASQQSAQFPKIARIIDVIFAVRWLQENVRNKMKTGKKGDLTKAFGTVNRQSLLRIMLIVVSQTRFLIWRIESASRRHAKSCLNNGKFSAHFSVTNGVKWVNLQLRRSSA